MMTIVTSRAMHDAAAMLIDGRVGAIHLLGVVCWLSNHVPVLNTRGPMKKFIISWVVTFVLWMAGSFAVHGALLHSDYAQLPNLFRPEADAQKYFPLMILAHVLMAWAFVWIYTKGIEAKPWLQQGLCYGLAVVVLTVLPTYIIYYVVQPMPGLVVVKQILLDGALIMILATTVACMNRKPASA